jgi:hypothetical protein
LFDSGHPDIKLFAGKAQQRLLSDLRTGRRVSNKGSQ